MNEKVVESYKVNQITPMMSMTITTLQHKPQHLLSPSTFNDDVDIIKWFYLKCTC
jgi:hypothetical protein